MTVGTFKPVSGTTSTTVTPPFGTPVGNTMTLITANGEAAAVFPSLDPNLRDDTSDILLDENSYAITDQNDR